MQAPLSNAAIIGVLCLLLLGRIAETRETPTVAEFVLTSLLEQFDGPTFEEAEDPSTCNIKISHDLGRISPVFVYPGTVFSVRAINANGHLRFDKGESIHLACPGRGNYFAALPGKQSEIIAQCAGDRTFTVKGQLMEINKLTCNKWPESIIYKSGTCLFGKTLIRTAFNISTGIVPLFESCYDPTRHSTIYTKYMLTADADGAQSGVKRPSWREVHILHGPMATNLYKKPAQMQTFTTLLGSKQLAERYISMKSDHFLSKGHLMAKSDHLFGAAQLSTFWYSNAAPQWQTFNGGNWNAVENSVRKLAARMGKDLTCYTGTYGTATLPDINGNEVELYLSANHTIPVPRIFFKVLYDKDSEAAIAIAGMNNPYDSLETVEQNVRCRDICSSIPWIKWKYQDLHKGYIFCCEVNDFRENYPDVLPNFSVTNILR